MKITVDETATEVTDGAEETDTVVRFGTGGVRMIVGDPSGRTYLDATPVSAGQIIIVPAGVITSAIMPIGKVGAVWKEEGFSA